MREMAKLLVMLNGAVVQEVRLTRGRVTVGRRRNCDIVLDSPAVSGDHALIERIGRDVYLEDRDSTNGTRLNGKRVRRQMLRFGDEISVARYTLRYCDDDAPAQPGFEHTLMMMETAPGGGSVDTRPMIEDKPAPLTRPATVELSAVLRIVSGPQVGREVALSKPTTTLGKSGVQVAIVTRRAEGFFLSHQEGARSPRVNGREIGASTHALVNGDHVDFMGVHMIFALDSPTQSGA